MSDDLKQMARELWRDVMEYGPEQEFDTCDLRDIQKIIQALRAVREADARVCESKLIEDRGAFDCGYNAAVKVCVDAIRRQEASK